MSTAPRLAARPARVLIVDDERHNRELLEVMLAPAGFVLQAVTSGEEALAQVAKEPPDLILLDVMMPGLDGYEVVARIKADAATRNIPVIIITSLDDRRARLLGLDAGAEDFLTRPVDRAELGARVRNLLRLKHYGDHFDRYSRDLEGEMRVQDEFLSHVSHELRAPLTAIKQFTSLLMRGTAGPLNGEQHAYGAIVLKNVRQLQSMIDDLLDVASLETGTVTIAPAQVSIREQVRDALDTLQVTADTKGITLSLAVPDGLPPALADATRLRQVIVILVDNAIRCTPPGGAISVAAGVLPGEPPYLLIDVADTGSGIHPELRERLFERLNPVPEADESGRRGLGLGLYICKELVTRQGGRIHVAAGAGPGTVFSFTLPLWTASPTRLEGDV